MTHRFTLSTSSNREHRLISRQIEMPAEQADAPEERPANRLQGLQNEMKNVLLRPVQGPQQMLVAAENTQPGPDPLEQMEGPIRGMAENFRVRFDQAGPSSAEQPNPARQALVRNFLTTQAAPMDFLRLAGTLVVPQLRLTEADLRPFISDVDSLVAMRAGIAMFAALEFGRGTPERIGPAIVTLLRAPVSTTPDTIGPVTEMRQRLIRALPYANRTQMPQVFALLANEYRTQVPPPPQNPTAEQNARRDSAAAMRRTAEETLQDIAREPQQGQAENFPLAQRNEAREILRVQAAR